MDRDQPAGREPDLDSIQQHVEALVNAAGAGDETASAALLPLVYEELRAIAKRLLGASARKHTLQPTALVHTAYLKLAGRPEGWDGRRHFLCVAAKAMRHVLADHAEAKRTAKRGGGWARVTLSSDRYATEEAPEVDLAVLDDALNELAEADPRAATVVELRFLGGMTIDDTADAMGVSPTTVKEDWRVARAWMRQRLKLGA